MTPAGQPKIILSTNVAETSVTIPGVVAVIDSGLARIASHSPWSGLSRLAVGKISQASAIQRAGRAGRTAPGRALRLYPRHDFESRRPYEIPEIRRLDLSEALLTLAALGVGDASRFAWFESPDAASLEAASSLLRRLGAIDGVGRTDRDRPAHAALSRASAPGRLLVEGERRGVGPQAAALAALLSEGDISDDARARFGGAGARQGGAQSADLLERLDRFGQARQANFDRGRMRALGVDGRAAESADKARRQYANALGGGGGAAKPASPDGVDAALAMAMLTAFPDRVMRRRTPGASQAVMSSGGAAEVGPLPPADLLVAVDAEERAGLMGRQAGRGLTVRLAVGMKPEWLLESRAGGTDRIGGDPVESKQPTSRVRGPAVLWGGGARREPASRASLVRGQPAAGRGSLGGRRGERGSFR